MNGEKNINIYRIIYIYLCVDEGVYIYIMIYIYTKYIYIQL